MSPRVSRSVIAAAALALGLAVVPSDAFAQRRGPVHVSRPVVAHRYAYRPVYYPAYYYRPAYWGVGFGFGYGWYAPFWYQYPYPPPPPYRPYYDHDVSARIEVTPRDAEVFVDGYFVGTVDDFDGAFQRLRLQAGEHTLEFYKEGYRTLRERTDWKPGDTYRVKFTMEPLAAGEPQPARPKPDPAAAKAPAQAPDERVRPGMPVPERPPVSGEGGALALRVQPEGAVVLVDGERWVTPAGPDPLVVHLDEGTHRVEVQKEGYRTYSAEIRVRRGETIPLNISLRVER